MSNKNKHSRNTGKPATDNTSENKFDPEATETDTTIQDDSADTSEEANEETTLREQLDKALEKIEKDKNDYLLLAADFDNYRKRMMREKAELLKNAAERVLLALLPIVDDFERGLAAAVSDESDSTRQGMELIYHKLIKFLESNSVKAMETTGQPFNAELHEAIATITAPSEDLKGKIIDTTQKGYMINDKVLRHAKVAVGE